MKTLNHPYEYFSLSFKVQFHYETTNQRKQPSFDAIIRKDFLAVWSKHLLQIGSISQIGGTILRLLFEIYTHVCKEYSYTLVYCMYLARKKSQLKANLDLLDKEKKENDQSIE